MLYAKEKTVENVLVSYMRRRKRLNNSSHTLCEEENNQNHISIVYAKKKTAMQVLALFAESLIVSVFECNPSDLTGCRK